MKIAVGVDLGGTNTRVAMVTQEGTILNQVKIKTNSDLGPEYLVDKISQIVRDFQKEKKIIGLGVGCPGPLSKKDRIVWESPNLPGWKNFPLGLKIEQQLELPVLLENDANAACLGEAAFGSGKNYLNIIYLTFGTGIGGGVIVDGHLLQGSTGLAGELGHLILFPEGKICGCGSRGCFEQYASATALLKMAQDKGLEFTEAKEIFELKTSESQEILETYVFHISLALGSLINIFEPEIIILGGGVFSGHGKTLLPKIQKQIQNKCFSSFQRNLKIETTSLEGDAGVLGAAKLVLDSV